MFLWLESLWILDPGSYWAVLLYSMIALTLFLSFFLFPGEKTRSPTPEKGMTDRLKHNDYNRYLYMQLQHVEMELELLGPYKFQKPQSYTQAVRQVQHMKGLLESQICSSGSISER